ncbi:MAG: NAD(P)H-hydrate dehydratase [Planctomycetaceae bacterium]|nr:NAD(P)H-hydrate dehydratase [Planctomycetaceae bacterium]
MPLPINTVLPALPARPAASHKGTFGKVLIVAGSRGMSGAACLAGLGALRGGAGLVQVAVPAGILPVVAAVEPSYLTVPLAEDQEGRIDRQAAREILALAGKCTAMAIGPGWGTSPDLQELARLVFTEAPVPLVVDADGLNALSRTPGGWPQAPAGVARVITPHPGEFARILGIDTKAVQADRETLAAEFAARHGLTVLLKGHQTVITDGQRMTINTTGNSGMSTGGTGDVLTGLITALLAQGLGAYDAARLGAHLHGLAGDLAAAVLSQPGLIASDLPKYLGQAWLQVGAT